MTFIEFKGKKFPISEERISNDYCSDLSLNDVMKLTKMKELRYLRLSDITAEDIVIDKIFDIETIEDLVLDGARISDNSLSGIHRLKNLKHLNLKESNLTRKALPYITKLKSLETLSLHEMDVRDEDLIYFEDMKNLEILVFRNEYLTENGLRALKAKRKNTEIILKGSLTLY